VFAVTAILTLALGIGANAAIGGIIGSVLLRAVPLPDGDAVLSVRARHSGTPETPTMSARDVEDWSRSARTVEAFGAWRDWSFTRSTASGRERYYGIISNPGMFRVIGREPVLGRVFTAAENQPGAPLVILLTESAWRARFGADPRVVGQTIHLTRAPHGERAFTIVGVMPDIDLPSFTDVTFWAPSAVDEDAFEGRGLRNRLVWARMTPEASLGETRAELATLAARLAASYPDTHGGWTLDAQPIARSEVGDTRGALLLFAAALVFVLLIACANVAGLLMARSAAREREFAMRSALGGSPTRMLRLVLAEAMVLGAAAGEPRQVADRDPRPRVLRGQLAPGDRDQIDQLVDPVARAAVAPGRRRPEPVALIGQPGRVDHAAAVGPADRDAGPVADQPELGAARQGEGRRERRDRTNRRHGRSHYPAQIPARQTRIVRGIHGCDDAPRPCHHPRRPPADP
jgi:hypothetical protein